MREYVSTDACLMEFLRRQLDDPGAERCGRCANCAGELFSADVDSTLVELALRHLRKSSLVIEPRKRLPTGIEFDLALKDHQMEPGRCLTRWGDPGLAQLVATGRDVDGRFDDELTAATARLVEEWAPTPAPTWLTWIPSRSAGEVIEDFAVRLADRLGLEAVSALERVRDSRPQKTMQNSFQQAQNVIGSFVVIDRRPGPILLIDDVVDSRWTLTVVAAQLLSAGSSPVYPLALADTSGPGS
jgi:ATP-dependent DNA helicase RecQ